MTARSEMTARKSSRPRFSFWLVFMFLTLLMLSMHCNYAANKSGLHYFLDMHDSPALKSQEEDFTNENRESVTGMSKSPSQSGIYSSMRTPPEGSIPRNHQFYPYDVADFARAGRELTNPILPSAENLARGQDNFNRQCAVCHGYLGDGKGPVSNHFRDIPSLRTQTIKGWSDGEIFHIITMGRGRMYPFAAQILVEDRWKIIQYVRFLQDDE